MRKLIISTVALASLASLALVNAGQPVAAKQLADPTCTRNANECARRCAANNDDWFACISRTCDEQYGRCGN
jgi:hypothetical protein